MEIKETCLNFLPWRKKREKYDYYKLLNLLLICSGFCLITFFILYRHLSKEFTSEKTANHVLALSIEPATSLLNQKNVLMIKRVAQSQQQLWRGLNMITTELPLNCRINLLSKHKNIWIMKGVSKKVDDMNIFIRRLNSSHSFKKIVIKNILKEHFIYFTLSLYDNIN